MPIFFASWNSPNLYTSEIIGATKIDWPILPPKLVAMATSLEGSTKEGEIIYDKIYHFVKTIVKIGPASPASVIRTVSPVLEISLTFLSRFDVF